MSKDQKVALVTAASKGIGAAVARKLGTAGYKLVLMSRTDSIYDISNELSARPIKGSVEDIKDLERMVHLAYEKYGRIDVLVNNSGHASKGELLEISDEDWISGFNILLMNVVRMSRLVVPIMNDQEQGGSIVNISTFGALQPSINFPISSVARAGLTAYMKLFSKEFASEKIRMNNVLPGFIDSYPADEHTINSIPLLRQGTPEEVSELVLFLASEKSQYITGQDILIDGGLVE